MAALDPLIVYVNPAQIDALAPALASGALLMFSVMLLVASAHGALPKAVRVKITLPALISAILGV